MTLMAMYTLLLPLTTPGPAMPPVGTKPQAVTWISLGYHGFQGDKDLRRTHLRWLRHLQPSLRAR